jgi:two-component system, sensor histidine kinase and response regulator
VSFSKIFRKRAVEAFQKSRRQPDTTSAHACRTAVKPGVFDFDLSRFLASMRHEIRSPLNAILGFSQLMQDDPELSFPQQQRAEIITRSGEQLLTILNGILELSRISAGLQTLNPTNFDLLAFLEALTSRFRQKAEAKLLILETDGIDRLPNGIFADEEKLRQILFHLLDHSIKIAETGNVLLRAWTEQSERNETDGMQLVILVAGGRTDLKTGGIDPEFDTFEQIASGSRNGLDMCLELTVSRQLARLMGGDVSAACKDGMGDVFRVEIPVKAWTGVPAANKTDDASNLIPAAGESTGRVSILTREMLSEIPEAIKTQIRKAVVRGRQEQILNLIQQVAVMDSHTGGKLRDLAAAFDYETLLQLLE